METNTTDDGHAEAIVRAVETADWDLLHALVEDMRSDPREHLGVTLDLALVATRLQAIAVRVA